MDAFVTIQYRGRWFWIDNPEISSRQDFILRMIFMSLTESEQKTSSLFFFYQGVRG